MVYDEPFGKVRKLGLSRVVRLIKDGRKLQTSYVFFSFPLQERGHTKLLPAIPWL